MGSVKEVRSGAGVYFEYRLDTVDVFRQTWPVTVIGIALLAFSLATAGPHQGFPTPGSELGVILILAGVMSFVQWLTATWVLGPNAVARNHRFGDSKKVDLNQLKRVRISTKWWSVSDRMGNRCLVPADTFQQVQVVKVSPQAFVAAWGREKLISMRQLPFSSAQPMIKVTSESQSIRFEQLNHPEYLPHLPEH